MIAGGLAGWRAGEGGSGVGGGSAVRFRCRGQRGHGRAALMATVLWARHGQNVANLSQTFSYRVFDGDLTETGREQALRLGGRAPGRGRGPGPGPGGAAPGPAP